MKVGEAIFEIGDIRGDQTRVELKYHPRFKKEIGAIFFVDPRLFKKEEIKFTNFRR